MEPVDLPTCQRLFRAFDTVNSITAYGCDETVLDEAERLCADYEKLFSHVDPQSELNGLNGARGAAIEVSPELAQLLGQSLLYCSQTRGLFDITAGPLVSLWDFKRHRVPAQEEIDDALSHVDYRLLRLDGQIAQLADPQARVALGGVAKGYIADAVMRLLASRGVEHAVVNLGGNVAVMGGKPDGSPFMVGLRQPVPSSAAQQGAGQEVFAAVPMTSGSIVTSGIYERFFELDGVHYHHILDPRTGRPAQTDILSASVVAARSIDADGYTTALVIMGSREALEFVEAQPNIEAVFMLVDGSVISTSGLALSA